MWKSDNPASASIKDAVNGDDYTIIAPPLSLSLSFQ